MNNVLESEENKKIAHEYKELLKISYQLLNKDEKRLIRLAFDTAIDAHKNQFRKTGEPYVFHPINVAKIVASEIGLDSISIVSALLHDVIEDSQYKFNDIKRIFGEKIAKIVKGLTKISNLKKDDNISMQAENFRKMLLTLNEDIRVILIKIADRLHNMQTISAMPEYKRIKISSETLYIYAPLAHRIGLYNIKTELENLSLKHTAPENYNYIKEKIKEEEKIQKSYIEDFSDLVKERLDKKNIKSIIQGRNKSIYSIYKKMKAKNISYEEIYDKFAIRIIYKCSRRIYENSIAWKIFSVLTNSFTHNPTRLRDWLSSPKSTGYEALHLTVMGPKNKWVEIQIRSERMHEIAEKGYAAHYKYKQNEKRDGIDEWLNHIKEVLENNNQNAVDFIEDFKSNLYIDEIFVFTPKGEVKPLPKGACALDFAFNIHTEIGTKTRGAKINGNLVPLSYILKSGDVIEIITANYIKPNPNWLDFVITSKARNKIKSSLNEEKKKIAEYGKELLRRKLKQLKIVLNEKIITQMIRYFEIKTSLDLFYQVAIKSIDNDKLRKFSSFHTSAFRKLFRKNNKAEKDNRVEKKTSIIKYDKLVFSKNKTELPYSLSKCCKPISGDNVFAFNSINEGLKIHKTDCSNAIFLQSNYAYRILSAHWINSKNDEFEVKLLLTGIDIIGLVNKITQMVSNNMNINMRKLNFETKNGNFQGEINVTIKNKTILNKLITNLKKLNGIDKVIRK